VRVKIPRIDDKFQSDWLRVAQPGAGPQRGALVLPEVDDEVLVAFEHGDIRRGYVIGGLYNGVDKPNPPVTADTVGSDGKVDKRSFTSRKGHFMLYSDKDGDEFIELATKNEAFTLKLAKDAQGGAILMTSKNLVKIDATGDITITSKANVSVEATGNLSMKGQAVKIEAVTSLELSGQTAKMSGTSSAEVSAASTKIAGTATVDLGGGADAALHAGTVRINS
jgi:uncharacterized protein involved in type VI secretion and phage assembly